MKSIAIATIFLALTDARERRRRQQTAAVPGARALTIEELLKLVETETSEDFDFNEADDNLISLATRLWDDANTFEYQKAAEAEYTIQQKYPYILCHIGKDEVTGKNLSGYQRKLALAEAINYAQDSDTHFRTLYNKDDFLCVYGQLLASTALAITGEEFIVQPILSSLKYMKGTVERIQEELQLHMNGPHSGHLPTLDIVLCPGVATAEPNMDATAEDDITESSWEDVPEGIAAEIIDILVPTTIASKLATSISDTYYLTSDMYFDAMEGEEEDTTRRSKLWKSLIEDYQESGQCDDTYSTRLKWTVQRSRDPDVVSSLLRVEFRTSGDTELDVGCMLTLSLAIASHPNVCSLEYRERVKNNNDVVTWLTQSELKGKRPFFDVGLDGTGQIVAVSDTGVDQDNCYFSDSNFTPNSFINPEARKIVQYRPFVDNRDDEYGHGTHTAGTIAGKRVDGRGMADGVAPGAKLAVADIGANGQLSTPLDSDLLRTGRPSGNCGDDCAHIHSASWGAELNFYTAQARNFDQFMYDNDDFLILVAAGNSGYGDKPHTVGSPATGKNIIAVGAHHNTDSSKVKRLLGPSYVADFSSRGPTSDGRMKPDLMAPGKAVVSAGALPNEVGECDPSSKPGANSHKGGLLSLQGTSMATPVVAGTAALVRQYFAQGFYPDGVKNEGAAHSDPSGALIKAVLMNGAQGLSGVDNVISGVTEIDEYDNNQGFGRMALQHSLYLPGRTQVQISAWDREEVNDQGSNPYTVTIDKSDGCQYENLSVTLVWIEPGSSPGCTQCVFNDLDLTVAIGGRTYYPNQNNGRLGPDRQNNAERVIIKGVQHGDVATIMVTGYNLVTSYQRYALVATGCFGGVANQNFATECSAFECDDSRSERRLTILLAIFIPLGVLIIVGCGMFFYRRTKQGQGGRGRRGDGGGRFDEYA